MDERKWLGGIIIGENGNLLHVKDEEAYDLGTLLQYHAENFVELAKKLENQGYKKYVKEIYTKLTFFMEGEEK